MTASAEPVFTRRLKAMACDALADVWEGFPVPPGFDAASVMVTRGPNQSVRAFPRHVEAFCRECAEPDTLGPSGLSATGALFVLDTRRHDHAHGIVLTTCGEEEPRELWERIAGNGATPGFRGRRLGGAGNAACRARVWPFHRNWEGRLIMLENLDRCVRYASKGNGRMIGTGIFADEAFFASLRCRCRWCGKLLAVPDTFRRPRTTCSGACRRELSDWRKLLEADESDAHARKANRARIAPLMQPTQAMQQARDLPCVNTVSV